MSTTTKARPKDVTARRPVYWMSDVPDQCQVTRRAIDGEFVDGVVPSFSGTMWACWHPQEFTKRGGKYGTGSGQLFTLQADGRWLKTRG
jgi:hypothetical protein